MKKLKGLMISTAVLLCTATAGALQANAGIGLWGESSGTFCSGDINLDGECTVADAVIMQQYLLGSLKTSDKFALSKVDLISTADLNLDGSIDVFDFIIMRNLLANPDEQKEISWYINEGTAKDVEKDVTEYVITSTEQLTECLDNIAYEDSKEYTKYTDDFFENNVLLIKHTYTDINSNINTVSRIFYDGDTLNIEYTYYTDEINEVRNDPVLFEVAVPKSRYHAEKVSWNNKMINIDFLLDESFKKNNITKEEFVELLSDKEELTWSDFENYRSWEIDNGLEYEVDLGDNADSDGDGIADRVLSIVLVGENRNESPESIFIRAKDSTHCETRDIYEFRKLLDFIEAFKIPENTEENRANAQKIADYAFNGLKNGDFNLNTGLYRSDITDNEEIADIWKESRFHYLDFVNEHTVKLTFDAGLFDVHGYLITDGTVEYELGWNDNIDGQYDGGGAEIQERNGNIYLFFAGT